MPKFIIIILISCFLVSCQKSYYTYDYANTVENSPKSNYPIIAQMVYRGLKKSNQDNSTAVKFEFLIENMGEDHITLSPENYYIIDENAKQIGSLVRDEHKQITLTPNTFSNFNVYYPLPTDYNLDKTKYLEIAWFYERNNSKHELVTKFDKRRLKRELDGYGYPYSARFVNGAAQYRRMGYGHSPLWRYQNLENSNFRKQNRRK